MKLSLINSTNVTQAKFACSGTTKDHGCGVISWHFTREEARYNVDQLNKVPGNKCYVETKEEALGESYAKSSMK